LKRASITIAVLVAVSVALVSCGSYNNPSTQQQSGSGLKFRAFVSNPLRPGSTGGTVPVLEVVDASQDKLSGFIVNMTGGGNQPGLMAVSPSKRFTVVFSALGNSVAVANNATEALAPTPSGAGSIPLPDSTESMVVGIDNATAYAAVRNAPVPGQPGVLGAVEVLTLSAGAITATIPIPNARYIVLSHNGNRMLVFGDNQNTVTVIAPSLIGTNTDPRTIVCPDGTPQPNLAACASTLNPVFDHPVWGIFSSDDSTAYILNCGPQCGGTSAGISVLDMTTNTAGAPVPVPAATIGLLSGSTLYVAGTPPGTVCSSGTAAPTCGTLDVVDLGSMTITGTAEITDGYHTHMEMGANGQLFIGARNCTNITAGGGNAGEVRGCLSIFSTSDSSVLIPPDNGDVTGIEPIPNRNVVYVVQNAELRIYDTTTGKLQSKQINITGQAIDVKLVDF
jgi:hypothetical protein